MKREDHGLDRDDLENFDLCMPFIGDRSFPEFYIRKRDHEDRNAKTINWAWHQWSQIENPEKFADIETFCKLFNMPL